MPNPLTKAELDKIVGKLASHKLVFGTVFYVSSGDGLIDCISAAGNMQEETPYYIASINKLIIAAVALRLITEGQLGMEDKLAVYLKQDEIKGLHVYKGVDYSEDLSIVHLLSQTSGLPDYLEDKQANGKIAMKDLEAGIDHPWNFEKVLEEVKQMSPHFPPGQKGKAKYIDTNHQILGVVIERITGRGLPDVLHEVFGELGMKNTYVFGEKEEPFAPIYYKSAIIEVPIFLASTRQDIISTAKDQMIFLKAFFEGYFYPKEKLKSLEKWNRIFFPFKYGIGIQKFYLPGIFSPFKKIPEMIGHSGSTGTLAFFLPERDLYITGTVNQQAAPRLAFQTMLKIIN